MVRETFTKFLGTAVLKLLKKLLFFMTSCPVSTKSPRNEKISGCIGQRQSLTNESGTSAADHRPTDILQPSVVHMSKTEAVNVGRQRRHAVVDDQDCRNDEPGVSWLHFR